MNPRFKIFKKIILTVTIIVFFGASGLYAYNYFFNNKKETYTVKESRVFEDITASGKAKSQANVSLGFEFSGKISSILVKEGDRVEIGTPLITLDKNVQKNMLAKAEAGLKIEKNVLKELQKGTRKEDLKISESELQKTSQDINDKIQLSVNSIHDSYTLADDAVHNKVDQYFKNGSSVFPQIQYTFKDYSDTKEKINEKRVLIEEILKKWKKEIDKLSVDNYNTNYVTSARDYLTGVKDFFDTLSPAVNSFETSNELSQATIDKYKYDLSEARTNIISAMSSISSASQAYNEAKSSYEVAQSELGLKKSGSTNEVLNAQIQRVNQAQSEVDSARDALDKTTLTSSINGVIADITVKKGEVVSAGESIINIISDETFELEADIPEVHVGKVAEGQKADIIFDAFPQTKFAGSVVRIDAAPTILDGVVNYKTTLYFDAVSQIKDQVLRSGMSATVIIHSKEKKSVVAVPMYALKKTPDGIYATLFKDGTLNDVKVEIGIQSDDGLVEILSGLNTDDTIVIPSLQ